MRHAYIWDPYSKNPEYSRHVAHCIETVDSAAVPDKTCRSKLQQPVTSKDEPAAQKVSFLPVARKDRNDCGKNITWCSP